MSSNPKKRPATYPFGKMRFYMSAVTTVLSVMFAAVILLPTENPILWLSTYFVSMLVIGMATFKLRIHLLRIENQKAPEEALPEAQGGIRRWGTLLMLFFVLLIALLLPLLMAGFLPFLLGDLGRYIWFILMVSAASGFSIAEILFYLYVR